MSGAPAFGGGIGYDAVSQWPADTEQERRERALRARDATLVLRVRGGLIGEQETGAGYRGRGLQVEQAARVSRPPAEDTAPASSPHATPPPIPACTTGHSIPSSFRKLLVPGVLTPQTLHVGSHSKPRRVVLGSEPSYIAEQDHR
jgi:hypothetical protein